MKRLSIALAAVGISFSVLAALPAATDPTLVAVPQFPGGFFVGGTGFYLQPAATNGDLDYAATVSGFSSVANPIANSIVATNATVQRVNPGYNWGWGVNAGYIFAGTGNDVEVKYFNLNTSDSDSFGFAPSALTDSSGDVFASAIAFPGGLDASLSNAFALAGFNTPVNQLNGVQAQASYNFNRVDLDVGQYIDVGCRTVLHLTAGATWAQVKRQLTTGAVSIVPAGTSVPIVPSVNTSDTLVNAGTDIENSKYNGVGPLMGVDASYYIADGFGLVAHADAALLIGNISATESNSSALLDIQTPSNNVFTVGATNFNSTRRVVPVVDGKLGLDYTFVFNNTANSDLTLEAGWQVSNYYNAVDTAVSAVSVIGPSGFGALPSVAGAVSHSTADVGLSGPYVSLVFHV